MGTRLRRGPLAPAIIATALVLVLSGCVPVPGATGRDRVVQDHNSARIAGGLAPLVVDAEATAYAQHTVERLRAGSGSHGCVLQHTSAVELSMYYPGRLWGENIGCYPGCASAAGDATPAFLASTTHRDNLLSPDFSALGVGLACNDEYLIVAVHYVS